jgi:methylmalonyl-CoA/ethylmalonyl-CoA epimerase
MTGPFRQLHHICLVVRDIDAAVAYYQGLGIGPWQDYPPLSQYTDLHVPDAEAFGQLKYKYVDLDNVQIQLCEPPMMDCPQRRFLDTRGEGVFQIGFEADVDRATAQGQAAGLDVLMAGRRDNGTGFVYFDTLDQAGVAWRCRQTKPRSSAP